MSGQDGTSIAVVVDLFVEVIEYRGSSKAVGVQVCIVRVYGGRVVEEVVVAVAVVGCDSGGGGGRSPL